MATEGRLSQKEEERLWILSIGPLISVVVCLIAYFAHLKSIGVIPSDRVLVFYAVLLGVFVLTVGAGIYEIASSRKVEKSVSFRVKRFLSRTAFFCAYTLGFYVLWSVLTLYLSSVLKEDYIMILSLLAMSLTLSVLISLPKTRRIIKKPTQEDSQPSR